jgi:hypothetical protein
MDILQNISVHGYSYDNPGDVKYIGELISDGKIIMPNIICSYHLLYAFILPMKKIGPENYIYIKFGFTDNITRRMRELEQIFKCKPIFLNAKNAKYLKDETDFHQILKTAYPDLQYPVVIDGKNKREIYKFNPVLLQIFNNFEPDADNKNFTPFRIVHTEQDLSFKKCAAKIEKLLKINNIDTDQNNSEYAGKFGKLFVDMCIRGYEEMAINLLRDPRINPAMCNNIAIKCAAITGRYGIITLLLADPRVDPTVENNFPFTRAARAGHANIVTLLLADKRINPVAMNNLAIKFAASEGHHNVTALLLGDSRIDPTSENNFAIAIASRNCHHRIVKLLINAGCSINVALDNAGSSDMKAFIKKIESAK